jgi:hypothetical protein
MVKKNYLMPVNIGFLTYISFLLFNNISRNSCIDVLRFSYSCHKSIVFFEKQNFKQEK